MLSTAKQRAIEARMKDLGIEEGDLVEQFILGSGRGGQKLNKTASCVYLRHGPTGIEVKCQRERSRALNRYLARKELCDKIAEKIRGEKTARRMEQEKIRRQKRRRSRRQKQRMLEAKRIQGEKKRLRKPPGPTE